MTTGVTAPSVTPKLPSEITGKSVEEVYIFSSIILSIYNLLLVHLFIFGQIIKQWNSELRERTGKFHKQAIAIAEWDRRILQNRDVLIRLEVKRPIISMFYPLLFRFCFFFSKLTP